MPDDRPPTDPAVFDQISDPVVAVLLEKLARRCEQVERDLKLTRGAGLIDVVQSLRLEVRMFDNRLKAIERRMFPRDE